MAAPAQFGSAGPYRLNVTLPVGDEPPDTVAVSLMLPPTVTAAEATVEIPGVSLVTVSFSPVSLLAPATAAFLASPE